MTQKHYMDITHLKPALADGFQAGDEVIIQEKIDGANFSIRYDRESDQVMAFSRKKELNYSETLRGAWNWSQQLDKKLVAETLGDNLILFGEWLCKHTVLYPADRYGKPYFYDVYDVSNETYLPQSDTKQIIEKLGLTYVPVFYEGKFDSWEHAMQFVGKTQLGGEYGEGIVIKNMTRLNDPNTRLPFYTKIVCEQFSETKPIKKRIPPDPVELAERERATALTASIVTDGRVRKLIHKFVDEALIPEDWDEQHMAIIAKNLGKAVYNDCVKEEPETVAEIGQLFGKFASSTAMKIARDILAERNSIPLYA